VSELPEEHLEYHVEPVIYVPWCTTVADVWERMQRRDREVAAVVNEIGETIGILTSEDLLDTLFTYSPSRSKRLLDRNPIHYLAPGRWLVAGVTSLRRLARYLKTDLPASKSVTIGGVVQETLQKLAGVGDVCEWGPFRIRVLEAPHRGHMLLELTRIDQEEGTVK
jgi:CBS domain containing-hemolysin-like protein